MDCGVAKIILLFISLIFWAAGAGLAYVGHYVIKSFGSFDSLIQNKSTLIPAAIIIGISAVMFFVGIVGCCSTLRESKCGLSFFFLIIMLIFAAEVTALVFSFIYRSKFPFAHDPLLFDFLQLKCCGVKNYTDWTNTTYFSTNKTLPLSCCKNSSSPQCNGHLPEEFLHDVCSYSATKCLFWICFITAAFVSFTIKGLTKNMP
uniref:Tetraspanin-3-like n=1 Tax=Pundamilia nyererei TaxID=303518 RepID=A0A3B4FTM9_9CICH